MPKGVYIRTKENCENIRKSKLGTKASPETKKKLSEIRKKHRHSISTRIKMKMSAKKGAECKWWKGGVSKENNLLRHSFEYRLWRESVFKRDNWTCIWCGERSRKGNAIILNADHIKPFSKYPELRFAIDNGRTLCVKCHKTTESYGSKNYA